MERDIGSYADDNTPYNFDFNLDNVISNIFSGLEKII